MILGVSSLGSVDAQLGAGFLSLVTGPFDAEPTVIHVAAEDRTLGVRVEPRTVTVVADDRVILIRDSSRSTP